MQRVWNRRGLVLDLRPRYKTRGNPDAEFATPAFEMQGSPHPSPDSKELEFSKSRISKASFMYKARVSRSKHRVYHTHVQRICDLEFKVNQLALHQEVWKTRLSNTGTSIRFQEKIKRSNFFNGQENRNSVRLSILWRQIVPTRGKFSLEVGLYSPRRSLKSI